MKRYAHYASLALFATMGHFASAQSFHPEIQPLKQQEYVIKPMDEKAEKYTFDKSLLDEIYFSEDFGDSLLGNEGNGLWEREGQHGLIWQWDFDGPDGPLVQNGVPLESTTGENGFFIFDADAADPLSLGIDRTGFLVSPSIDLSLANSTIVQFQNFFNYCCYNFSPLSLGVSTNGGDTWIELNAIPSFEYGANTFSDNPLISNIDISPYAAGHEDVKIRFGFNPDELEEFTHYFWAIDDILIFENPVQFDLEADEVFMCDINEDFEYLRVPEAQTNVLSFSVILTNRGGQVQNNVYAQAEVFFPGGNNFIYQSEDTVTLGPGVTDTLYITTDIFSDDLGTYECFITTHSDELADDEVPDNNDLYKSFTTNEAIFAHEFGDEFDNAIGSRPDSDNPGTYKEFALGAQFRMRADAILDGIQLQLADSSTLNKTIYPIIYHAVSGDIQGVLFDVGGYSVDNLQDGHSITEDDLNGESFSITLTNEVALEADELYIVALFSEEDSSPVYFRVLDDEDSDNSTVRYGLDQNGFSNWFNGYDHTPAIRMNFDVALGFDEELNKLVLRTYPNPANEFITIEFDNNGNDASMITIYDMTGKRVLSQDLGMMPHGFNSIRLELDGLNSGLYFYELNAGGDVQSDKFIKR